MAKERVRAFLSCSVRPEDRPLVDALVHYVIEPMYFDPYTIGRNVSMPLPPDDAVKKLLDTCVCLIGVATVRHVATDVRDPNKTLNLANPYLLQEASMAFQAGLPFLLFKTRNIDLQAVATRPLYLNVKGLSASGKPILLDKPDAVRTSLETLHTQALAFGKKKRMSSITDLLKTGLAWGLGGYAALWGIDKLQQPDCFGEYYYAKSTCKPCDFKDRCKARKAELKASS